MASYPTIFTEGLYDMVVSNGIRVYVGYSESESLPGVYAVRYMSGQVSPMPYPSGVVIPLLLGGPKICPKIIGHGGDRVVVADAAVDVATHMVRFFLSSDAGDTWHTMGDFPVGFEDGLYRMVALRGLQYRVGYSRILGGVGCMHGVAHQGFMPFPDGTNISTILESGVEAIPGFDIDADGNLWVDVPAETGTRRFISRDAGYTWTEIT